MRNSSATSAAIRRAIVLFPVPDCPLIQYARPARPRLASAWMRWTILSCPTTSDHVCGRLWWMLRVSRVLLRQLTEEKASSLRRDDLAHPTACRAQRLGHGVSLFGWSGYSDRIRRG